VKDLESDPMKKGVCGVNARPESSALPKPPRWTGRPSRTIPSARPGMRASFICLRIYASIAVKPGAGA